MNPQLITTLETTLAKHMALVRDELATWYQSAEIPPKIIAGSWTNPWHIMAYVSILPHGDPSEETIDICITLSIQTENSVIFESDICRSDGKILAEFINCPVSTDSSNALICQVEKLAQESIKQIFVHLRDLDFEKR